MSTAPTLQLGFTQETFQAFLDARREPAWLVDRRREAWQHFANTPMPDTSQEEWRRTDIRMLRLDRFGLPAVASEETVPPRSVLAEGLELGGRTVTLDGRDLHTQLEPEWSKRGVLFDSLDRLAVEREEVVRPRLTQAVDPLYDKFSALHAACWSGGTLLYVPRNVVVQQPLHMLSCLSPGATDLGHALIVLEEGAEATLLAETASSDPEASGLHAGAVEIFVGPGAKLRYVNLQNWGSGVWHVAHQKAIVERSAQLQWTIGALGSRLAKVNQHVALVGPSAGAEVNGVMFTQGRQHLSYHTLQHHAAPNCHSDLLYKGALQDKSHLVWRGMIRVDKDAVKTDAYQRDDNLILTDTARVDSIPGLEILADDVRCSHGATAGRVDDEQVFYARSRGLTRKEAIRMIVAGFFQQVFDRISIPSVREVLGGAIGRRVREYE